MEEQLISFKTAKLAKEKGFNWKTENYIYDEFIKHTILKDKPTDYSNYKKGEKYECIGLPTQSLLQRWLREVHNIIVDVSLDFLNPYTKESIKYSPTFYTYSNNKKRFWLYTDYINSDECTKEMQEEMPIFQNYFTWEEALEIGLQEALKLI